MDLFGHKSRHAKLTNAITTLSEAIAGLHTRLNAIDRRIEQTHTAIAEASQENRNHADAILTAIAEHTHHIRALRDEHTNVRMAMTHVRHSVEKLHDPVTANRVVPSRG